MEIKTKIDKVPLDALLAVLLLFQLKHVVVEKLLQLLVGVVDAQLLKRVLLENLKARDVQDTNKVLATVARLERLVDARDKPAKDSIVECFGECVNSVFDLCMSCDVSRCCIALAFLLSSSFHLLDSLLQSDPLRTGASARLEQRRYEFLKRNAKKMAHTLSSCAKSSIDEEEKKHEGLGVTLFFVCMYRKSLASRPARRHHGK